MVALLGITSLIGFAAMLTRADTAFAGRAYAAYGGIYIAASLIWLWAVEGQRPHSCRRDRRGNRDHRVPRDRRICRQATVGGLRTAACWRSPGSSLTRARRAAEPSFDTFSSFQHPLGNVLTSGRRLSALLLSLALSASHVALCAGWMTTPEARMACCSEGAACPMHKSDSPESSSKSGVTQAEADSCCAASERDSAPSASVFMLAVSFGVVPSPVPLVLPSAIAPSRAWRLLVPAPSTHVPKHLLLSVFLV